MAQIFVSYKTEDRERVRHLVEALRAAGFDTWWDQDIPPGGGWRETIAGQLDSAELCIVAWSRASVGEGGRFVREEAERAAGRGAYLGVLIDPVMPPFGFAEWQAIDLSAWMGARPDPFVDHFIGAVRARLANAPPPPRPAAASRPRRIPIGRIAAIAGVAVLLVAGLAAWRMWPSAAPAPALSTTVFVNDQIDDAQCAWLQIAGVTPAGEGREWVSLAGIAAAPEALQTALMRRAIAQSVPLAQLDVAEVASAPPQSCDEIELLREFRWQGPSRLTIIPPRGQLSRTRYGWTGRFEFETDFARLPARAALLGLDSVGGVEMLVPDLHAFRREHPPLRSNGTVAAYEGYFFDDNQDALNVGLILMTATGTIDQAIIEAVGERGDREFIDRLDRTATDQGWQFELALVRCGFESGERRQC
jgi:hypothetical protein